MSRFMMACCSREWQVRVRVRVRIRVRVTVRVTDRVRVRVRVRESYVKVHDGMLLKRVAG
jgi:hypothetical protein